MSCIIYLDNFQGQYYPGNVIVGRVICTFNSPKNIRGIRLKLRGKEHTAWTKTESYYDDHEKRSKTRTVHYSGYNKFLVLETSLSGGGEIPAGRHEYHFTYNLPRNIPGTYIGTHGWVKFFIKATVDRPYKIDYEDEKEFNVVAPIDFNEMRGSLQLNPVHFSDDKTLCCCCCASDPITMNIHLEKEAFVVGETAKVKVQITNMANANVERVEVSLGLTVRAVTTSPRHDSKEDFELLATSYDSGVGAHGERSYEFHLEIPQSAVVPNFNLCTLFSQRASLKVKGVLPSCHTDLGISTHVTMGHIPLGGYDQVQYMNQQQSVNVVPPYMVPQNSGVPIGGMPYPSNVPPYPPDPSNSVYPPDSKPPPYPPQSSVPGATQIGFAVPQSTSSSFPSMPPGGAPPGPLQNPAPYPPVAGPSAPPVDESAASAPPKEQLAKGGEGDFVMVGDGIPLLGGDSTGELPPPSYNDAVSYPTKK